MCDAMMVWVTVWEHMKVMSYRHDEAQRCAYAPNADTRASAGDTCTGNHVARRVKRRGTTAHAHTSENTRTILAGGTKKVATYHCRQCLAPLRV